MTTQRFKTVVAKEGSRTSIAIPFNPNEIWGVKQRHWGSAYLESLFAQSLERLRRSMQQLTQP